MSRTKLSHPSERECAKILDFYKISWEYEPTTFPIDWDRKGRIIQSFTPDFYLPDQDVYIELTTMSQKLVTKKKGKVRRLREIPPNVNIWRSKVKSVRICGACGLGPTKKAIQ